MQLDTGTLLMPSTKILDVFSDVKTLGIKLTKTLQPWVETWPWVWGVDNHAQVRKLGSIRYFKVTSANVVRFMPNFVHIIIQVLWNNGSDFGLI